MAYILTYKSPGVPGIIIGNDGSPYNADGSPLSAADMQAVNSFNQNNFNDSNVPLNPDGSLAQGAYGSGGSLSLMPAYQGNGTISNALAQAVGNGITQVGGSGYSGDFPMLSSAGNSDSGSSGSGGGGGGGGGSSGGSGGGSSLGLGSGSSGGSSTGSSSGSGFSATTYPAGAQDTSTNIYAPTPQAYTQAGNSAVGLLNTALANVQNAISNGQINNQQQLNAALQNLSSQTGLGLNEIQSAFNDATSTLNQGFNQGANDITGYLQQAIDAYQPVAGQAAADMNYLRSATQGGFNQDLNDYLNSAAFQFPLQQATNNLQQSAANKGKLFSGATGKAIMDRSMEMGQQGVMSFLDQRFNQANQIANNSLNALGNQANLQSTAGTSLGNLRSNQANAGSGILTNYGTNVLNARQNLGTGLSNTSLGFTTQANNLTQQLAQALGQHGSAAADYTYNSQIGRGTKAIEIKV